MNKTNIEWVRNSNGSKGYSSNPVKGICPVACSYDSQPYCYSRRLYLRYKWDPTIRLDQGELSCLSRCNNSGHMIFVGSTIDLFHSQVDPDWVRQIIAATKSHPQNIYVALTKCPGNLVLYNFPANWWVGVSITAGERRDIPLHSASIKGKRIVSFEPLLGDCSNVPLNGIDWVIIGGLNPGPVHQVEWIDKLLSNARQLKIPVFIKDNARYPVQIQEWPQ